MSWRGLRRPGLERIEQIEAGRSDGCFGCLFEGVLKGFDGCFGCSCLVLGGELS